MASHTQKSEFVFDCPPISASRSHNKEQAAILSAAYKKTGASVELLLIYHTAYAHRGAISATW